MKIIYSLVLLTTIAAGTFYVFGNPSVPPVYEIESETPQLRLGGKSGAQLIEINKKADLKKYFAADSVDRLKNRIDFSTQKILVFAWMGSGKDKMNHSVDNASPPQINFKVQHGRSRDLRSHTKVYALKKSLSYRSPFVE